MITRYILAACLLTFCAHASRPGLSELLAQSASSSSSSNALYREALMPFVHPENLPKLPIDLWDTIIIPYLGADHNPGTYHKEDEDPTQGPLATLHQAAQKNILILEGHTDSVFSAQFNHDDTKVVTAGWGNATYIWDANTGKLLQKLKGHFKLVDSAEFNHDNTKVVTARLLQKLEGHTAWVNSAEFSHDDTQVVTTDWDNTACIWDANTGKLLQKLEGHTHWVYLAKFSYDDKRVVTASQDTTACIWNASTGKPLQKLKGHISSVRSAQFSHDDKRVVTTEGWENTACIWDANTGKLLQKLEDPIRYVYSAPFSHNDAQVVTANDGRTARIWNIPCKKITLNQWVLLLMLEQAKKQNKNKSLEQIAKKTTLPESTVHRIFATFKDEDQKLITRTFIEKNNQCCAIQ